MVKSHKAVLLQRIAKTTSETATWCSSLSRAPGGALLKKKKEKKIYCLL